MRVLTIPNIVTCVRILLIPLFVTSLMYRHYGYALALFLVAGLSDMLDGFLARVTNQKTELGAFLDPLADKFLLITSFIFFAIYDWIPAWLAIVVISRDLVVVLGWVVLYLLYNISQVRPTAMGKAAIALQLILITYVLVSVNTDMISPPGTWIMVSVAALTVYSGFQYLYRGLRQAGEK